LRNFFNIIILWLRYNNPCYHKPYAQDNKKQGYVEQLLVFDG